MGNYKKGLQLSEDPTSFFSSKNYPTVAEFQAFELNKLQSTYPPNVSKTQCGNGVFSNVYLKAGQH